MRRGPRLPLEELAPYLLPVPQPPRPGVMDVVAQPLDWHKVFGNDHPVELEVGFGKGLFLVTTASARADVNFVGVEIVRKYQLFTATRLAVRGLRNVRVACTDVLHFLPRCVASSSLQAVHVYFPDPWWKTRHHKRRIFTPEFVTECVRVLRPGGRLLAATDVEEYAQVMADVLERQHALRPLPLPPENIPINDLDYLTNFERKFRKQGKTIHRFLREKAGTSSQHARHDGAAS